MSVNSKMTSIARKINMSFWLKRLWGLLSLDILIVALVGGSFLWWRIDQLPMGSKVKDISFLTGDTYRELVLVLKDSVGVEHLVSVGSALDYFLVPFVILLIVQAIDLFGALFETGSIRRKLIAVL